MGVEACFPVCLFLPCVVFGHWHHRQPLPTERSSYASQASGEALSGTNVPKRACPYFLAQAEKCLKFIVLILMPKVPPASLCIAQTHRMNA